VAAEGCVEALQAASSPIIKLRSGRQERIILRLRVGVGLRLRHRLRSEKQLHVEAFRVKIDLVHIEIFPIYGGKYPGEIKWLTLC